VFVAQAGEGNLTAEENGAANMSHEDEEHCDAIQREFHGWLEFDEMEFQ
jgi:hypothetical protein